MNRQINYLYIVLCALFFTIYYLFYKVASKHIGNFNLIALQYFIISIILFFIFIIFRRKKFIEEVNLKTIGYAFAIGVSSIASAVLLYILLKTESYSKIVPVLEPLIVVMSSIIGIFYFNNRLTMTSASGIVLSIIGIYLMVI
jgi:uncharacterized membrane protein